MHVPNKNLKLLCLASEGYQKSITGLFDNLNIAINPVRRPNGNEQIFQDDTGVEPLVLVLPENNLDDEIAKKFLNLYCNKCFVIFFAPLRSDILPLLDACNDFCGWPCDPLELSVRINHFLAYQKSSLDSVKTNAESPDWSAMSLLGKSSIFTHVKSFILKASTCDAPVLIESETGCGKEVTARAIHYLGSRKDYPFIPMNCGAIPDQLIENELFGHEKGAYTDAKQCQSGLTEQANGGTLFLDEIEALSAKGQVTLLRFIEDNMVRPLGATKSKKVDVRVIAASNICLAELVAKGQFRQDLLFRLNLLHLNLPPLRDRREDIPILAEHFLEKFRYQYLQPRKYFHSDTLTWMLGFGWPGNVRELENFVHRSFLLSHDDVIITAINSHSDENLPNSRRKLFDRRQNFTFDAPFNEAKNHAINHFERSYLTWLISNSKGNVTHAADQARKERRALGKLLKKHEINPDRYRLN